RLPSVSSGSGRARPSPPARWWCRRNETGRRRARHARRAPRVPAWRSRMKNSHAPLPPGAWLGLLGGGQLGRMFCMAAQSLGYRVCVLDPGADSPAGSIAERHLQADYLDEAALDELAGLCKAVTTEFENVPAQALERLAARCIVSPRASSVAIAQDRIAEKSFLCDSAIPVAPWAAVLSDDDLRN